MRMRRRFAARSHAALATEQIALQSSTTRLATSLITTTAAFTAIGVAGGAFLAFVGESIREYDKQTGALDGSRSAVERWTRAWNSFEAEVGRRLVSGGEGGGPGVLNSITSAFEALTPALAEWFTYSTGLENFAKRVHTNAEEFLFLAAAVAQYRGQLDQLGQPSAPRAPGMSPRRGRSLSRSL